MINTKALATAICLTLVACASTAGQSSYKWTRFVQVEGQPEPVPIEWVSTPEGKFAHSIKIPNPVPKDSGYKPWMSSEAYFKHLCETEAGEFVFRRVDKVDSLLQSRPMNRVRNEMMQSRFGLEYPEFAIASSQPLEKAFVRTTRYSYFETPPTNLHAKHGQEGSVLRFSGYNEYTDTGMVVVAAQAPTSLYAFAWRGLRRPGDREKGISGGEVVVFDLNTKEVLGVRRSYLRSGDARNARGGIWWEGAHQCPKFRRTPYRDPRQQLYDFISSVLRPANTK